MWSKRKDKKEESEKDAMSDKAANGIARAINGVQNRFGNTLNKKTQHLSRRGKIIFLIVFCILFGGGSIYIVWDGLSTSHPSYQFKPQPISFPKHLDKSNPQRSPINAIITAADIRKIKQFRRYMDSLKTSPHGTRVYDSINRVRPGLMDSLTEVERLYGIDSTTK